MLKSCPLETATIAFPNKSPRETEKTRFRGPPKCQSGPWPFLYSFAGFRPLLQILFIFFAGFGVSVPSFRPGRFCTCLPVPADPVSPAFGARVPSCPVGLPGPAVKIRALLLLFALCATGPLVLALLRDFEMAVLNTGCVTD